MKERAWLPRAALHRFAVLSFAEKLIVGRALLLAFAVEIGLRTLSLMTLARLLGVRLLTASADPRRYALEPTAHELQTLRAVDRVLRHWPFGPSCLRRSLILGSLLRSKAPVVHIGVARQEDEIRAHAWLEIDGVVAFDSQVTSFVPLHRRTP